MAQQILIKVYGDVTAVPSAILHELQPFFASCEVMELSEMLVYNADSLQMAFEGVYFDIESVLLIIQKHITPQSTGRIDYIDLEAWNMTRYRIEGKQISSNSVGLNNVLDYAGL